MQLNYFSLYLFTLTVVLPFLFHTFTEIMQLLNHSTLNLIILKIIVVLYSLKSINLVTEHTVEMINREIFFQKGMIKHRKKTHISDLKFQIRKVP